MGIFEEQEWLFDLVSDKFSDISGIRTGIEEDTVVYQKNAMLLWMYISEALKIRTSFVPNLMTIEDYVHEWSGIIKKHNTGREIFIDRLQKFIADRFGREYQPNEQLCSELMPKPIDEAKATKLEKDQYLREEMAFANKVGTIKNAVRNRFGYFKYCTPFYEAQTINRIADVLFGKEYPVL